jgi:DNA sulfur modification protein DndD
MEKNADKVREAVHQMLGLELLLKAINDLTHQSVRGVIQKELRDNTDSETQLLIDRREKLLQECVEIKRRLDQARLNEEACAREVAAIDANLRANQEARELQERRGQLEDEQIRVQDQLQEATRRLAALIADDGYAMLSEDIIARARQIVDRMRAEGKIPARILNDFIEDLLRSEKCICGCELKEGTSHYISVRNLLTIAGDQHFNNSVGALDNALGVMSGAIPRARASLKQLSNDRASSRVRLMQINEELADIHTKLDGKDDAHVHQLETKRAEHLENQRRHHGDQRVHERDLEQRNSLIEGLDREISQSKQKEESAARAQSRLNLLDESTSLLKEMLAFETEDLRKELGGEITKHFDRVKIKPDHWLELTPEFTLQLKKWSAPKVETIVAPSKGERQVMALVFIASLVALAKRRSDIPTVLKGLDGVEYPVVMDSPFGAFGVDFRSGVAKWIPQLASQVIMLVSSTQYRGEVDDALSESGRVGRRYLLVYNAPTKKEEARESITIRGKKLKQFFENDLEHTEIKEIELN